MTSEEKALSWFLFGMVSMVLVMVSVALVPYNEPPVCAYLRSDAKTIQVRLDTAGPDPLVRTFPIKQAIAATLYQQHLNDLLKKDIEGLLVGKAVTIYQEQ